MRLVKATAIVACAVAALPAFSQEGEWGTIKGRIVWGPKDIPQPPMDPAGGGVLNEKCVVNGQNRGLRWTLVWLTHDDPKNPNGLPTHPDLKQVQPKAAALELQDGGLQPPLLALREGQDLLISNTTPAPHGIRWVSAKNSGAVLLPAAGHGCVQGLVAERLPMCVYSSVQTWKDARIAVFRNPYFAVTDADGAFEIKQAPAGKYRLMIWNHTYNDGAKGRFGQPIAIPANATLDLGAVAFNPP
jgi:hypothetical protein